MANIFHSWLLGLQQLRMLSRPGPETQRLYLENASTEFLIIFQTITTSILPHNLLNHAAATRACNEL